MSTEFCPQCHQVMPHSTRIGVSLTPLKARIFDLIDKAGEAGISGADINAIVFENGRSRDTIKAHIWQINEALMDSGWQIIGDRWNGYRLKRRHA